MISYGIAHKMRGCEDAVLVSLMCKHSASYQFLMGKVNPYMKYTDSVSMKNT